MLPELVRVIVLTAPSEPTVAVPKSTGFSVRFDDRAAAVAAELRRRRSSRWRRRAFRPRRRAVRAGRSRPRASRTGRVQTWLPLQQLLLPVQKTSVSPWNSKLLGATGPSPVLVTWKMVEIGFAVDPWRPKS